MNIQELVQNKKGTIIDVRTDYEFAEAHAHGAINIPVYDFADSIEEIKQMKQPIILCCASGGRSNQAFRFLSQLGVSCVDAGPWQNVYQYQNEN
ncbi:MAG TPA: rhodanese-like domain-containing protein [Bacteroidia bacterium]|nr:rhodanese-like domain-containing protein [Bacteroidia bacterium]